MVDINAVNEYLALHLRADFWSSLTEEKKQESFKQAVDDVCSYLGIAEIETFRIFQLCAVAEQSIYLADNNSPTVTSPRAMIFMERESVCLNSHEYCRNDENSIKGGE